MYLNKREAGRFTGTHVPHVFDLTPFIEATGNELEIIFDLPPRWLGHCGYTSRMTEWKTRFNYTWDWCPRLVQTGIWDSITLVAVQESEIRNLHCVTEADLQHGTGVLRLAGEVTGDDTCRVQVSLEIDGIVIRDGRCSREEFTHGLSWIDLPVELWWPNLEGAQPLYSVTCILLDAAGREQDRQTRRVGFMQVDWLPCEGAPPDADPWLCVVNGRPVFLQGVNFAPLCANYADLTFADYATRLQQYQQLGVNLLRINACQFLERSWFYELCDELGLLVWQEFPLTSSGLQNWPPEDAESIAAVTAIAASYIERRQHHVSLLLWSGGNEQIGDEHGEGSTPCDLSHPLLRRLQEVAQALDTQPTLHPDFSLRPARLGYRCRFW